jgi:primosomal protein N' (replication factor Y)
MQSGAIDILVGTQMVKGHDLPASRQACCNPTRECTCRISRRRADLQLLEQGGRGMRRAVGAGDRPDLRAPDHPAIAAVGTDDYAAFVMQELKYRRQSDYPPFARMVVLRLTRATKGS